MELALPHVLVRVCSPGVGPSLCAAMTVHPVEISEARDASEARAAATSLLPTLVVVTDPPDPRAAVAEIWSEFPRTPILIVGGPTSSCDQNEPSMRQGWDVKGWVDTVPSGLSLTDLCWLVLEALSRAVLLAGPMERPLGPVLLEVDDTGTFVSDSDNVTALMFDGHKVRLGQSALPLVDESDRESFAGILRGQILHEARFFTMRLLGLHGCHVAFVGLRRSGTNRVSLLIQPLIVGGPVVGRHINGRDPVTGLLTRWEMARVFADRERSGVPDQDASVMILKLENFSAISEYIGPQETKLVLVRVASVLRRIIAYPAVSSRPMGDTFLVYLPTSNPPAAESLASAVIRAINGIDIPGFRQDFRLGASAGVAGVSRRDYDMAIRCADAAASAAAEQGGNRAVIAGPAFGNSQSAELAAKLDLGEWEVYLQPVAPTGGPVAFHESLARFTNGHGHVVSRADFFATGRGQGLLERFDNLMLRRVLQILAAHPRATISVNITFETFLSDAFPACCLDLIREFPDCGNRIILEILPYCLAAPARSVTSRLETLAAAGVAVALDDFGSGICRLNNLTQFPFAIVKLDELVTGYVGDDPLQREFVRTVTSICRARGMTTVAEFTRSPGQLQRLVEDGVDLFQGELLGMPAPAGDVLAPEAAAATLA